MKPIATVLFTLPLLLSACGPAPAALPTSVPTIAAPAPRTLTVFAAASLTASFNELGKAFQAMHPRLSVTFNFAGSQALHTQLQQGAEADVFASADHKNTDELVTQGLVAPGKVQDLATNFLVVILPANNSADIHGLHDLARPGLKLSLADASVPAGVYSRQVLDGLSHDATFGKDFSAKVLANAVSNETDVKQVVAKVQLGEADAGIVYITDAIAAPGLKRISIPDNWNILARYTIAPLADSHNSDLAAVFIDYALSPAGQSILSKYGFTAPEP